MSEHSPQSARTDHWRKQIEAWRVSGQSQRAFCKRRTLSYAQFQYWRRKLGGGAAVGGGETAWSGFVAVRTQPTGGAVTDNRPAELTVVLPNGVQLRGVHAGNLGLVGQLVRLVS
jgi:hypothetical protein